MGVGNTLAYHDAGAIGFIVQAPGPIFASKAGAYLSGALSRCCPIGKVPGLTFECQSK